MTSSKRTDRTATWRCDARPGGNHGTTPHASTAMFPVIRSPRRGAPPL